LCLVGPVGTGKTTFSQIISQALGKKYFPISLGGLSDSSVLVGNEANSPANNMGQLARALVETKTSDPVILLDEIDKTGLSLKNCLVNVLDSTQNQNILDHFLEVKLDFSQVTFVITTNDLKKIPDSLSDRMLMVKLPGYTADQKREIAHKIIQK
jgi:ATP-dependent Lon protease